MHSLAVTFSITAFIVGITAGSHGHGGDDDGPAYYKFEYGVHDPHTGDHKSQYEHADGHVVKGAYTLKEADGTHRVVEYVADHKGGFNAVVNRIGLAQHPAHYGHGGHGGHSGHGPHGGDGGHGRNGGHGGYGGHGGTSYVGTTNFGYGHGAHGGQGSNGGQGGHGSSGGHGGYGGTSYVGTTHFGYGHH